MSNILAKDSSNVSYTQKLTVSKQFDNFAKRTLRVTETGPSRIHLPEVILQCQKSNGLQRIFIFVRKFTMIQLANICFWSRLKVK